MTAKKHANKILPSKKVCLLTKPSVTNSNIPTIAFHAYPALTLMINRLITTFKAAKSSFSGCIQPIQSKINQISH